MSFFWTWTAIYPINQRRELIASLQHKQEIAAAKHRSDLAEEKSRLESALRSRQVSAANSAVEVAIIKSDAAKIESEDARKNALEALEKLTNGPEVIAQQLTSEEKKQLDRIASTETGSVLLTLDTMVANGKFGTGNLKFGVNVLPIETMRQMGAIQRTLNSLTEKGLLLETPVPNVNALSVTPRQKEYSVTDLGYQVAEIVAQN